MGAKFTALFWFLHILLFLSHFSFYFSQNKQTLNLSTHFDHPGINTFYYCAIFYIFLHSVLSFMTAMAQNSQKMKLRPREI